MESSEPVEDAPTGVNVVVRLRDGMHYGLNIPDRTVETMHAEIDDGFVQGTYIMFESSEQERLYLNPREVVSVEVKDAQHD